jgi:hypothetical protein
MSVLIGTDTVTSIARHVIMPTITDQIYNSNILLYRLMRANKRVIGGGTQIEVPQLYADFGTGSAYQGFETLVTTPHDTVKNLVFDWKQYYVTWAVDGLTLIKTDSADAIANLLTLQSQQAYMRMGEILAAGLFGDGVTTGLGTKELDGIRGAVGNASVGNANYGGISRSTNTWHVSQIDATASALSFSRMRTNLIGPATIGGYHPTIILSGQTNYNRHWLLHTSTTGYSNVNNRQPAGHDELLASAGFTNLLFDNIPHVVDSHVHSDAYMYALNENVLQWVVSPRADFYLEDFQKPVNQDAMVATLLFAGNLISQSSRLHAALTGING